MTERFKRDNLSWLRELRGRNGTDVQAAAFEALGNYLYVVGYNYLRRRQGDVPALDGFAADELAALTQDFVQDTLEKMARDGFALLNKFAGSGAFTSWAGKVLTNRMASELRTSLWSKRQTEPEETLARRAAAAPETHVANEVLIRQVIEVLRQCIQSLPPRRRLALEQCLIEEQPAAEVARQVDSTINAVHQLVFHAKQQVVDCLRSQGYGPETLTLFSDTDVPSRS